MDIDLSTEYLGLKLASPLIASASPCTGQPDVLRRMEAAGAGAAVLPSLFEEQIMREGHELFTENERPHPDLADSWVDFPNLRNYNRGTDEYARLVDDARRAVSMPIIGSLNGTTPGGWIEHARRIADAGANALELNLYFIPTDASVSGQQVEAQYLDVIAAVRAKVDLPLAVKIGPFFSSLPYFARQAVEAGVNGLVLFNRYLEPQINLDQHSVEPHLELSRPSELRLTLRWLAILRGQVGGCSLAASSGIHSGVDALRALAAGGDVAMVASVLLKRGAEYLGTLREEMLEWLSARDFSSLSQLVGSISHASCGARSAYERANYAATLASYMDHGPCPN